MIPNNKVFHLVDHCFTVAVTFIMLMICVTANAQTISFMGVPLAGNINKFTEQLRYKGVKYNKYYSTKSPDGVRAYDVKHFQYPCMAKVEYNPSTKNVYEGLLMFQMQATVDEFVNFVDLWSRKISEKYSKGIYTFDYEEEEYKSLPVQHYTIYSSKNNMRIGEIYLYMDIFKKPVNKKGKGKFALHILYRNSEAPSFEEQVESLF